MAPICSRAQPPSSPHHHNDCDDYGHIDHCDDYFHENNSNHTDNLDVEAVTGDFDDNSDLEDDNMIMWMMMLMMTMLVTWC